MSDLQLSLIVIGVLVVVGVYLFNWNQERRFRRETEQILAPVEKAASTALPVEPPPSEERVEPRIEPVAEDKPAADVKTPEPVGSREAVVAARGEPTVVIPAPAVPVHREPVHVVPETPNIDYRARLAAAGPMSGVALAELAERVAGIGKPVRVEVRDGAEGPWRPIVDPAAESAPEARFDVQLADRSGPLSVAQVARFRELLQASAADLGATVEFDDENAALATAAELDAFCADHDVAIGLNVVPNETMGLLGTKLRALAESSGFVLAADGAFHLNDERGGTLVALMSMDGVPFEAGSLKNLRSYGITLLLDVPRVGDGRQVFRRMTDLARHLATSLDGTVVDDKRTPLEQPSLDKITRQIESIQQALKGRGIIPGGPVALRLFQ